ncbi:1,4-alpha-glucan branching protein GlgB [Neobacillus thermocopriae]|uniref:1,4-alpha-glucan branching enzyme GlgB n=1 Tax=Neobacillus thermocopriae TaxID=1215031 RepID=A0A6B3TQR3_9BACI|nr:1,4-alpha-glucan branching protein GlgB [Neobacillus thermocopriae]MED3623300.1 1,4-alpha-glucan branching protein GlgB [Neobacillus thermocopriae]MED3715185.1 1,4-alpha-glucan branching protein GlgB [Neobacillus thermocopriae]NEX78689.1 1,4-alpha-glucan branching protein GlgB [Neobacillus thermocopriae]
MAVNTLFPTDYQLHLFHEGNFFQSHELFGAHIFKDSNNVYTRFCVWAPNACQVRLVGDFNNWNGEGYELQKVNDEGVWVIVVNQNLEGNRYKFEIFTQNGERFLKADPYAFYAEKRPNTASIVYSLGDYEWQDAEWMNRKAGKNFLSEPSVIYEVHLGSWKKHKNGDFLTYKELADELIPYVVEHGFTHIEILPLVEHPLDISWGYQGTGYFAATSRYGTPNDFCYFVDQCHQNGIGVILDWVPGHYCKDAHGLYRFDGTHLYSYQSEHDRENVIWGTANFDLGRGEVQSFLISNALFWMEYFHIDGFRMDAVANIIYWPNALGEKSENPYGIHFLRKLNQVVHDVNPHFLMIGEDSTDFRNVTTPVQYGGLGFDYKWNMGWMNDILEYMETPPFARSHVHSKVTFSLLYAFSENFMLPFSHDEVVHGKKSLLNKMPGDYWEKFAQLRLLLGYMFTHPGKKLLFMGFELGMFSEWKDKEQMDWHLLDYEMHEKLNSYVKVLTKVYKRSKALYELDHLQDGFEWIDVDNKDQSIFSFIRKGKKEEDMLVIVCNFTGLSYPEYKIGVPKAGEYREIFTNDLEEYGGSGVVNKKVLKASEEPYHGKPYSINLAIAPYGFQILRPVKKRKERKSNGKEKVRRHAVGRRKREQA